MVVRLIHRHEKVVRVIQLIKVQTGNNLLKKLLDTRPHTHTQYQRVI